MLNPTNAFEVFNIGSEDWTDIGSIIKLIEMRMGLNPTHKHIDVVGGQGDIGFNFIDITKINKFGWKPKLSSREAISKSISDLINK